MAWMTRGRSVSRIERLTPAPRFLAREPTVHDMNSGAPSHHWFHYTDVPVVPAEDYRTGNIGRSKWDIVHMIPYCVEVLQGRIPEQNERKITKPVALILLTHYVGDIHQPLHVGAQYFDSQGRVADPDKDKAALGDEGGNTFMLELSDDPPRGRGIHKKKFHGFWDYDTVNALFPQLPPGLHKDELQLQIEPLKRGLVHQMATQEPPNWRMPANIAVTDYAELWANEILPVAREAHARLEFRNVRPFVDNDRVVAAGEAIERPVANHALYRSWASSVVRDELHKAGWRLADLLQKIWPEECEQCSACESRARHDGWQGRPIGPGLVILLGVGHAIRPVSQSPCPKKLPTSESLKMTNKK
jgi:hypothetical protein